MFAVRCSALQCVAVHAVVVGNVKVHSKNRGSLEKKLVYNQNNTGLMRIAFSRWRVASPYLHLTIILVTFSSFSFSFPCFSSSSSPLLPPPPQLYCPSLSPPDGPLLLLLLLLLPFQHRRHNFLLLISPVMLSYVLHLHHYCVAVRVAVCVAACVEVWICSTYAPLPPQPLSLSLYKYV